MGPERGLDYLPSVSGCPQQVSCVATQLPLGLRFSPSLFLLQTGPTSNHQSPPRPPFLSSSLTSALFWQPVSEMSIQRAESGRREQTQVPGPRSQGPWGCCTLSALLEFAPTPTPSPLGPGASVHCQSMSPMCWKHPCLSSFLHPHLRYSFRREEIPPCVSSKPQDLAQCLAHSRSQQMWAETFNEDGPMEP